MAQLSPLPSLAIGTRYRCIEKLGEGGSSIVWKVQVDNDQTNLSAIKVQRTGPEHLGDALRREFSHLFRIRHPHIVRVEHLLPIPHSCALPDHQHCGLMLLEEYIEGVNLREWAKDKTPEQIASLICQIASALATLHINHICHCDIKPENILVQEHAQTRWHAKLIDFGLSRIDDSRRSPRPGPTGGTPAYMAPEALKGHPLIASDIYSLGRTIEELFSLSPPDTPLIQSLAPLVQAMLSEQPATRPNAQQVFEALQGVVVGPNQEYLSLLAAQGTPPARSIGQHPIIDTIATAIEHPTAEFDSLTIQGHPGCGKTTMMHECVARLTEANYLVIGTLRHAGRGEMHSLEQLLNSLRDSTGKEHQDEVNTRASHLPPLPSLNEWLASRSLTEKPWEIFETIRRLLEVLCQKQAIALIWDDLLPDTLLEACRRYLHHCSWQCRNPVVWIQSTPYPQRAQGDTPLYQSDAYLGQTRILEPLRRSEITQLIAATRPLRPADQQAADWLLALSGGHPGHLVSLLQAHPAEQLFSPDIRRQEPQSEDMGSLLAESCLKLLPSAKHSQILALIATLDPPAPIAFIALIVPTKLKSLLQSLPLWLRPLEGYIRINQDADQISVCIESLSLRSHLSQLLKNSTLKEAASLLEKALEDDPSLPQTCRELVGMWWLKLESPKAAIPHLRAAARYYAQQQDLHKSTAIYETLYDLKSLSTTQKQSTRIELAHVYIACGQANKAMSLLANQACHDPLFLLAQTRSWMALGNYTQAIATIDQSLSEGGQKDSLQELDNLRARCLLLSGQLDPCDAFVRKQLKAQEPHPDAWRLQRILGLVAYYRGHYPQALDILNQCLNSLSGLEKQPLPGEIDGLRTNLALVHQKMYHYEEAKQIYQLSLKAAQQRGDIPKQVTRLVNLATLLQECGDMSEARQHYDLAYRLSHCLDGKGTMIQVALNWANLDITLGNIKEAEALIAEAHEQTGKLDMPIEEAYLHLLSSEACLHQFAPTEALQHLEKAQSLFATHNNEAGQAEAATIRSQIYLFQRNLKSAGEEAEAAATLAMKAKRPRVELRARLCSLSCYTKGTALDEPSSHPAPWLIALNQCVTLIDQIPDPDLRWRVHLKGYILHDKANHPDESKQHKGLAQQYLNQALEGLNPALRESYLSTWQRSDSKRLLDTSTDNSPLDKTPGLNSKVEELLKIYQQLSRNKDPGQLVDRIIDAAMHLCQAERGLIVLLPQDKFQHSIDHLDEKDLLIYSGRTLGRNPLSADEQEISRTVALQCIQKDEIVTALDAQTDRRLRQAKSVHTLHIKSVICLPLRAKPQVCGALYLDYREHTPHQFSPGDLPFIQAFATQAAMALTNAWRIKELKEKTDELARSQEIIESLNTSLEQELAITRAELKHSKHYDQRGQKRDPADLEVQSASPAVEEVHRMVERVADKDCTVTIIGASGTGKEVIARKIHEQSKRSKLPFVPVNCGAIAAHLWESELFGHQKGAFTGAVRNKPGLFDAAGDGTLFLDEIGDMPLDMQVKMLRVLQQREYRRVGDTAVRKTKARILTASHRDIPQMVRNQTFREDLWYRLNVVEIRMPLLRERREDIPSLAMHFLAKYGGDTPPPLARESLTRLVDYDWPGNVRELENAIQRALVLCDDQITPGDLPPNILNYTPKPSDTQPQGQIQGQIQHLAGSPGNASLKEQVMNFERQVILSCLREHKGNMTQCAKALRMTRAGLYKKMHKLEIHEKIDDVP